MKECKEAYRWLRSDAFAETAMRLYGAAEDVVDAARLRLLVALNEFVEIFGGAEREVAIFSAPGRTELGGNHTDHQHGHVLAASVQLDTIAIVARREDRVIRVHSAGFAEQEISLDELKPISDAEPTSAELIRGIVARFAQLGVSMDTGFDAYTQSMVLPGSGMSSSAAFEVLIGSICNTLYADGRFTPVELAQIGQYAENVYYHKPCGLMDQIACAYGGAVAIDFADSLNPLVRPVSYDFSKSGYALCLVDTGGSHADLTAEYAAIPAEMQSVAAYFGEETLSAVSPEDVLRAIPALRKQCGDRAVLRAMHFYREDGRAQGEADALERGDFEAFLHLVQNSGDSSYCLLQNVYAASAPQEQPISVALAVGSAILGGRGAIRVHGGGFGGTIQAFVPTVLLLQFQDGMRAVFGENCCHVIQIRPVGGVTLFS